MGICRPPFPAPFFAYTASPSLQIACCCPACSLSPRCKSAGRRCLAALVGPKMFASHAFCLVRATGSARARCSSRRARRWRSTSAMRALLRSPKSRTQADTYSEISQHRSVRCTTIELTSNTRKISKRKIPDNCPVYRPAEATVARQDASAGAFARNERQQQTSHGRWCVGRQQRSACARRARRARPLRAPRHRRRRGAAGRRRRCDGQHHRDGSGGASIGAGKQQQHHHQQW